eukprot:scaffold181486_cov72-Attheya_sp.AAC.1
MKMTNPIATGNRQQATGNRQQATGNRQQATGNRQQATGNSKAHCIPNSLVSSNIMRVVRLKACTLLCLLLVLNAVTPAFSNKKFIRTRESDRKFNDVATGESPDSSKEAAELVASVEGIVHEMKIQPDKCAEERLGLEGKLTKFASEVKTNEIARFEKEATSPKTTNVKQLAENFHAEANETDKQINAVTPAFSNKNNIRTRESDRKLKHGKTRESPDSSKEAAELVASVEGIVHEMKTQPDKRAEELGLEGKLTKFASEVKTKEIARFEKEATSPKTTN